MQFGTRLPSPSEVLARYNLACELAQEPNHYAIVRALRGWARAAGVPDLSVAFVEDAAGVRDAMATAARENDQTLSRKLPLVARSDAGLGNAKVIGARAAFTANAAAEPAFAKAKATSDAAEGEGKRAWEWGVEARNPSTAQQAWGLTGSLWSAFYHAREMPEIARNALWAAAGGRSVHDAVTGGGFESQGYLLEKCLYLFEAFESGAWVLWFGAGQIFVAVCPRLLAFDENGQLHSEDGPAFVWLDDRLSGYYWHGVYVPDYVILRPEEITAARIDAETNDAVRRAMLERSRGP